MSGALKRSLAFNFFEASYSTPDMVALGVEAEKHGFSSVMMGDHLLDLTGTVKVDPWTVLSYIGAKTKEIRLTTQVTDALRTHPAKLAHIAATLDELTGGRVTLGLGAGESMNLVPFGIDFEKPRVRVSRLREAIQVIKMLFKSSKEERVSFKGQFYRLEEAWLQQLPVQKLLPIGIGALGARRSLELVGELGDGWQPAYNTLDLFRTRLATIKEAARSFGRNPRSIDYSATILAVISDDEKVIRRAVDAYRGSILSLAPKLVKQMGLPPSTRVDSSYDYQRVLPNDPVIQQMDRTIKKIPDEVVKQFMVIGSADELVEAIDGYRKAGATSIIFWDMVAEGLSNSAPMAVQNMRLMRDSVIPQFAD